MNALEKADEDYLPIPTYILYDSSGKAHEPLV